MHSALPPTTSLMSVEAYLEQEKISEIKHEYIAGVLYPLPGTSKRHNRLLGSFLMPLMDVRQKGCHVFATSVKLHPTPDVFYYPDLMFTCEPSEDEYVVYEASLVIEILSESSHMRDRLEKWLAYKQMDSLEHYLLVHQDEILVEHFYRQEGGQWQVKVERENVALTCPEVVLELPELYAGIL